MFFNEDHLRVTKVRTQDGMTPVFGENGKPETKIVTAPDTKETRRLFDEANSRLPNHLKMKIERVKGYKPELARPAVDVSALEKEIAELKDINKNLVDSQAANKEAGKPSENGETKPVKEKVK